MVKKNENQFALDIVGIRKVKEASLYSAEPISNPIKAVELLGEQLCEYDREVIAVVNLSSHYDPINVSIVSIGTLNHACLCPGDLLKSSILSNAAYIMMVHNHPSGNLMPSEKDTTITHRLYKACEIVGIPLLDHIIVGGDNKSYFSFHERHCLEYPKDSYINDYRELTW